MTITTTKKSNIDELERAKLFMVFGFGIAVGFALAMFMVTRGQI